MDQVFKLSCPDRSDLPLNTLTKSDIDFISMRGAYHFFRFFHEACAGVYLYIREAKFLFGELGLNRISQTAYFGCFFTTEDTEVGKVLMLILEQGGVKFDIRLVDTGQRTLDTREVLNYRGSCGAGYVLL